MIKRIACCALGLAALAARAEWPQWRGPSRNGIASDSPRLLSAIPKSGLTELWSSEPIPSEDEGGVSSPVVAGGRVFISLVWHRKVSSEKRQIDELVLRQLGYEGTGGLDDDLLRRMEQVRESLDPQLRGKPLEEFTARWLAENFTEKQRTVYAGFVTGRFKKGRLAIPLAIFAALERQKEHVFASDAEMGAWLDAQNWPVTIRDQIAAAVPASVRAADDTIICLDLAGGQTRWKTTAPGAVVGSRSSATPTVMDGKLFAVNSARLWCLDAETGTVVWETRVDNSRGIGASPLVVNGVVVVHGDALAAYDIGSGEERWRQPAAGRGDSSPVSWSTGAKTLIVVNSRKELQALDSRTGDIVWSAPGGGASTPAIVGDLLAVQTHTPAVGLIVYQLSATEATKLWNKPLDAFRTQSSPIIYEDAVYLMDNNVHYCLAAESGTERWRAPGASEISSPVLADGKLFVLTNNGNTISMLKATAARRVTLGKATVRAHWVPSPCISDGKLVLRLNDRVKCWSLAP